MINQIHLYGDSILDNDAYVAQGTSVSHQLLKLDRSRKVKLRAVDGDVTQDTLRVLYEVKDLQDEETGAVLSVGGNDALVLSNMMLTPVDNIAEAFAVLYEPLEQFRLNYKNVVEKLITLYPIENIRICTIYNRIPAELLTSHLGITAKEMMALALFNDIITETAVQYGIKVIDLRVICDTPDCYSRLSPIEPSEEGGRRIAENIIQSFDNKEYEKGFNYVR